MEKSSRTKDPAGRREDQRIAVGGVRERYMLAMERIGEMRGESLPEPHFDDYFHAMADFLSLMGETRNFVASGAPERESLEGLSRRNRRLYEDILPENYGKSYANPDYAVSRLGENFGKLLSFVYAELRSLIVYAYERSLAGMTIRLELFLEIYQAFLAAAQEDCLPKYEEIQNVVYWFMCDYLPRETEDRVARLLDADRDFALKIVMDSDLEDLRYLYRYGEYVTDNELETARYLNSLPGERIELMARTYTEGYRLGFQVTGKDMSRKRTVDIRYALGFERLVRQAVLNFEAMGLKAVLHRAAFSAFQGRGVLKNGYFGANPNKQYDFDHREDDALYLNRTFVRKRLAAEEEAFRRNEEKAAVYGGPAVVEVFGETPFAPENKKSALRLTKSQQKLSVEYRTAAARLQNEYIREEERSFTIIAFPVPAIGDKFPEIFDEIIRINTLDYKLYREIQQRLIDVLDQAAYVRVRGRGKNRTDMRIQLHPLADRERQTNFENCVADVNIPVGEVFTTPLLQGTEGVLHVTRVFLNELEYRDLTLTFREGRTVDYRCANFAAETENRRYIQENLLFRHDFLPLGEFAIGTNTTAYRAAQTYDIADKLPILIAEKMGPHFAVGDSCYSHAEEIPMYNPDGKEMIARDNEISLLRGVEMDKAYFNCHTDITIPYDELGELTAVTKDGRELPVIAEGRFVVEGCEELNRALEGIPLGE